MPNSSSGSHSSSDLYDELQDDLPAERFSGGYRNYVLSLLLITYILNHLDRQIVNILAEPIKRDLELADWQLGLMGGFAFALLYTVMGIPIARLAEKGNRPAIIAIAIGVWSAFTALSGMAQNFWQLTMARIGVGVGEAGCTPPAHSLIVDYTLPEKRASALAFYGMGPALGGLVGMSLGGIVADAYGWRTAFLIVGLPGLGLALLVWATLREPRKLFSRAQRKESEAGPSLNEALKYLLNKKTFWILAFASSIKAFISYGKAVFIASFFLRSMSEEVSQSATSLGGYVGYDLKPIGFLGISLGLIFGVFGALGTWLGGQISDRYGPKDIKRYMYIGSLAAFATVPTFLGMLSVSSLHTAFVLLALFALASGAAYGPTYTVIFSVVHPKMRATTSAVMLFTVNLIGLGFGPLFVGILSDHMTDRYGYADGLRIALFIIGSLGLVASALYLAASRTVANEIHK